MVKDEQKWNSAYVNVLFTLTHTHRRLTIAVSFYFSINSISQKQMAKARIRMSALTLIWPLLTRPRMHRTLCEFLILWYFPDEMIMRSPLSQTPRNVNTHNNVCRIHSIAFTSAMCGVLHSTRIRIDGENSMVCAPSKLPILKLIKTIIGKHINLTGGEKEYNGYSYDTISILFLFIFYVLLQPFNWNVIANGLISVHFSRILYHDNSLNIKNEFNYL